MSPRGLALDNDGNVLVADETYRVLRFSPDGTPLDTWGPWILDNFEPLQPNELAVTADGAILIADPFSQVIVRFVPGTGISGQIGTAGGGFGAADLAYPEGVAVASNGEILASNTQSALSQIKRYKANMTPDSQWGARGSGATNLDNPRALAIDSEDHLYVVDSRNHRIQKFTLDGTHLGSWGSDGSNPGQFKDPRGIAVDADSRAYVTDSVQHRVQKFSPDGTFLGYIGGPGNNDGEFSAPWGIAVAADGTVYICDAGHTRIQAFVPVEPESVARNASHQRRRKSR
ncbi:MAG: NHL repeat-containing protein [Chloroflexota bacterium]|nr:NHL repeat-containing protein [Chloroflexota bacterium]